MPGAEIVSLFQSHKQGQVIQPESLLVAKAGQGRSLARRGVGPEVGEGPVQQVSLVADERPEIHPLVGESRYVLQVRLREVADLHQFFGADEHRVAGEGGERLVGRVGIAGGAQGEHLPVGLAGCRQEVYKPVGSMTQVADAEAAGE